MKPSELRNMTDAEIQEKVRALQEELFKIRQESSSGHAERPHRFNLLKKDIARCLTILKEKKSEK